MTAPSDALPRTRSEAKALGNLRYFTGKECINGHLEMRATATGTCMECARVRSRQNIAANPEKKKAQDKAYAAKNKEKIAANLKRWKLANPDYQREWFAKRPGYSKEWKAAHAETTKASNLRTYARISATPKGRISAAIRAGIQKGLKKGAKSARKTFDLLGYSVKELMAHLESKFLPGMSWDNYGEWHIDHKIPLNAHNYGSPDDIDFKKAWALSNLQPLWAFDNMSKHSKLDAPFQPSFAFAGTTPVAANDNCTTAPTKRVA